MLRAPAFLLPFLLALPLAAQMESGLRVYGSTAQFVDPALPFTLHVSYANIGETPADDVTITIDAPQAADFTNLPASCAASGSRVTCSIGTLPPWPHPGQFESFDIGVLAPAESDARIGMHFEIRASNRPDLFASDFANRVFHTLFVENTDDSGPGSLRSAVATANAECVIGVPCKIAFRIPSAAGAVQTIRPASALPAIVANSVWLDGASQSRYVADTNANGPEIEISGALQAAGNGIEIGEQCSFRIEGLIVNGFANNGIEVHGAQACTTQARDRVISGNYLGTDATGTAAMPNNRGITLDTITSPIVIENNLVSGNLRSGIFIVRGAGTVVRRNTIGLDVSLRHPLGNGASGVYIAPEGLNSDVNDNFIGFNAHFGAAVAQGAIRVAFSGNSFQANHQLAIDYGMDGVTESIPEAYEGAAMGTLPLPVIIDARYDAANDETVISGTAPGGFARQTVFVSLYANDAPDPSGYGEGQYTLGSAVAVGGAFSFHYPGRTPGPWIAATATRRTIIGLARGPRVSGISGSGYVTTTTEFSRTIQVQE